MDIHKKRRGEQLGTATYIDSQFGKQTTNGVATVAGNVESNVKRTKVLEEFAGACCGCAEQ